MIYGIYICNYTDLESLKSYLSNLGYNWRYFNICNQKPHKQYFATLFADKDFTIDVFDGKPSDYESLKNGLKKDAKIINYKIILRKNKISKLL